MSKGRGTTSRAYVLTDWGRRYLRMVDAGLEHPVPEDEIPCGKGHVDWNGKTGSSRRCHSCCRDAWSKRRAVA